MSPEEEKSKTRLVDWTYAYEKNQLSKIVGADDVEVSYGYDERGQLLWEKQGERKAQYTVKKTSKGSVLTNAVAKSDEQPERWSYDLHMRPVEAELSVGRSIRWKYGHDNEVSETLNQDGKLVLTRTTSQDGKTEKTILTDGKIYEVRRDACRPVPQAISRISSFFSFSVPG